MKPSFLPPRTLFTDTQKYWRGYNVKELKTINKEKSP